MQTGLEFDVLYGVEFEILSDLWLDAISQAILSHILCLSYSAPSRTFMLVL